MKMKGNLISVIFLLLVGVAMSGCLPMRPLPLHNAAGKGDIDAVENLLNQGTDVNLRDISGWTPLMYAAIKGRRDVARFLIEKGADIEYAIDKLGRWGTGDALAGKDMLSRLEQEYKITTAHISGGAAVKNKPSVPSASVVQSDVDKLPSITAKKDKNSYAIVIGIESYRQKLPKADFAVADAKTMTEYLTKVMGYPEENVVTLTNEHAAKSDFEKYFEKWLPNNVEKDGSVFIYYSGHGAPNPKTGDAFLVPYDGDPAFIDQTGYSLKRLYENLGKLQAKEIIVALDSCFSGAGGRSIIAKGARPLVMTMDKSVIPI